MQAPRGYVCEEPFSIILSAAKQILMADLNVILAGFSCLLCIALAGWQIYANRRHAALVSFSTRCLPACLLTLSVISVIGVSAVDQAVYVLPMNLVVGIFSLLLLSSSFLPKNGMVISVSLLSGVLMNGLHLCALFWWECRFDALSYCACAVVASFCYVLYFLVSLGMYVRRIRNVVQKTTAWTILVLSVDVVYIFFVVGLAVSLYGGCGAAGEMAPLIATAVALMLLLMVLALAYRISTDSLFFLMRHHETVILESLNDAPYDIAGDRSAPENVYKDIFGRVVDYFESDVPYLRGDLVIEDLVKVVYANKLYISRAISRCTGRNFCQFVNYYRVRHSVEVFRKNPELKVAELASQSGFNSVVSFTMAFKLYMNENPSDWIRQERSRMIKCRL